MTRKCDRKLFVHSIKKVDRVATLKIERNIQCQMILIFPFPWKLSLFPSSLSSPAPSSLIKLIVFRCQYNSQSESKVDLRTEEPSLFSVETCDSHCELSGIRADRVSGHRSSLFTNKVPTFSELAPLFPLYGCTSSPHKTKVCTERSSNIKEAFSSLLTQRMMSE